MTEMVLNFIFTDLIISQKSKDIKSQLPCITQKQK